MEGLKHKTGLKWLALGGLALLALGGLVYASSLLYNLWGLAAAGLGLVLIVAAAAWGRKDMSALINRRSLRLGLGAGLAAAAAVALAVFLGALASRHNLRFDFTSEKMHSLAPQSLGVVKKIPVPVKAYAFFLPGNPLRQPTLDLLDRYAHANRNFSYQVVDPDQQPMLAKRYQVSASDQGAVILVAGDREEKVKQPEEQSLTNALIRLTRKGKKTIYFLQGHGEKQLSDTTNTGYSSLKAALEQSGYRVQPLILATQEKVPPDASAVVVAGPRKALLAPEKERLDQYLQAGGGVLVLLEPNTGQVLKKWLASWGVRLDEDIVFDLYSRLFQASPAWPLAAEYGDHPITKPMKGLFCFFPIARSLELIKPLPQGVSGVELVKSSPQSWAETDLGGLGRGEEPAFDQQTDRRGPITLAVALTVTGKKAAQEKSSPAPPSGRLVVFGDSDFVGNGSLPHAGNRDLMLNSLAHLAQEEDLVSIRAKEAGNQPLMLTPLQGKAVFWIPVVIMPLIFVLLGVVSLLKRRRPA
ncbi:MAG: GldG family protein [Desulfarculaceae bacterium]